MGPVVCWVTDRRRFGDEWRTGMVQCARECAAAGVHLIQVREPGLEGGELFELARRCVAATAGTRTRIVVNDRMDVALAAGAHGVHLPSAGLPPSAVRAMAPSGFLVGRSVHGIREADVAQTAGLDYLVLGTLFPTLSKPGQKVIGLEELRAVTAAVTVPVLAIGGMAVERLRAVAEAGASGFAAIGIFAEACAGGSVRELMTTARAAFDGPGAVS